VLHFFAVLHSIIYHGIALRAHHRVQTPLSAIFALPLAPSNTSLLPASSQPSQIPKMRYVPPPSPQRLHSYYPGNPPDPTSSTTVARLSTLTPNTHARPTSVTLHSSTLSCYTQARCVNAHKHAACSRVALMHPTLMHATALIHAALIPLHSFPCIYSHTDITMLITTTRKHFVTHSTPTFSNTTLTHPHTVTHLSFS
jgi:hypothetical protein